MKLREFRNDFHEKKQPPPSEFCFQYGKTFKQIELEQSPFPDVIAFVSVAGTTRTGKGRHMSKQAKLAL